MRWIESMQLLILTSNPLDEVNFKYRRFAAVWLSESRTTT